MPTDSSGNYWIARDSSGTYSADYYMALARNNASTIASYNTTINTLVTSASQAINNADNYYPKEVGFNPYASGTSHTSATTEAITLLAITRINDFVESAKYFTEVFNASYANINIINVNTALSTFRADSSGNFSYAPYYLHQGGEGNIYPGTVTNTQFLTDTTNIRNALLEEQLASGDISEYDVDIQNFIDKAKAMKVTFDALKAALDAEPTTLSGGEEGSTMNPPTYYTGRIDDPVLNDYYNFYNDLLNYNLSFDSSNNLIIPAFPSAVIEDLVASVQAAKTIIEQAPQAPPPPTFVSRITDSSGVTRIKFRGDTTQVPQAPFVQAHFEYDSTGGQNFEPSPKLIDIFSISDVADTTKIFNYPNAAEGVNGGVTVDASGICFAEFIFTVDITVTDSYTISWYLTNGNTNGEGTPSAPASFTLTPTVSLPGKPNAPTLVTRTGTTITVSTSITGISGNPFTSYSFTATDSSNNTFDSSGNEEPDASGNYTGTISGLTAGRSYNITATLFNTAGNTTSSPTQITTGPPPGTPNAPILVSKTQFSLTVRASTTGVSGGPFTAYLFRATDSNNDTYDSSGNGAPDSSGNYIATITELNAGIEYNVTITLFNINGNTTSSPTQIRTVLSFGDLENPTLVSASPNTLVVRVSTTDLIGERPLTGYLFRATDSSNNTFDSSGNGSPDSSGNYTAAITGLTPNTSYTIMATVFNEYISTSAFTNDIQTSAGPPPGTPPAPTLVSASSTSLTVRSNLTGVSGGPFSEILFTAIDSSGSSFSSYTTNSKDASGNYIADSSGNFLSTISGLTPNKTYNISVTLTNENGSTTSASSSISTANGFPGTPPAPTLVSATSDSLSLRANAVGVSGAPFNLISFTATDSSGSVTQDLSLNDVDASGNYLPDASGNYLGNISVQADSSGTLRDIFRNTNYSVRVIFSNIYGSTTSSSLSATTTINNVEFGINSLHINASRYLYVFISLANTSGSPFTSCDFNFTNSSNNNTTVYRYIGEELVGGKSNYFALITTNNRRISGTPIFPNTTYKVNATLYNSAGSVSGTQYSNITTLLENVQAVLISKTSSSIVVSGDLGKLTDGSRLDVNKAITDVLINYMDGSGNNFLDASGNPLNTSVSGPDASGNYTGTMTGLTGNTQYSIYFSYFYDANLYSSAPINVTTNSAGPPPGTPNAPTLVSASSTSLTVRSNVNGVSGGPFNGVSFTATDSSGNTTQQNASNSQDASGNYIADSSGNFTASISGTTTGTSYSVRVILTNDDGSTTSASSIIQPVPGTPNTPTLISATGTTITLRNNVNGVSGAPFTQGTFSLDRIFNGSLTTLYLSTSTLDSSGNYTVTFTNLPYSTTFDAIVYLNNNTGVSNPSSPLTVSTLVQSPPGQANRPVLVQSLSSTSIIISTNTNGVSGEPFTQVEFLLRDSSSNIIFNPAVFNSPDSSGNYTVTVTTLTQSTLYYITARLTNGGGVGVESSSLSVVTQGPPQASSSPVYISKTATSITVFSSTQGILGSPFTGGIFRAVDSVNQVLSFSANPSNATDSSGNYIVDSSGNYSATITGLSQNTQYNIIFTLVNIYGSGPDSSANSITTEELPGTANVPTQVSVTTTSITIRTSTNEITGGTFTGYRFRATDSSGIFYDSSGNGSPDASGNYNDTISGLNSSSTYDVTATLFNTYGAGPTSASTPITTSAATGPPPGTANPPTLVSKTATSITMTGNPTGISGSPFSGGRFTVIDSSGTTVTTANPTTLDASGNYTSTLSGLTQNTSYSVTFALSNSSGNGQASSPSVVTTGAIPGTPPAPTLVSKTLNSLTVRTSTTGVSGTPFTSYRFRATDSSNNTFDSSGNEEPDASGNYTETISGLSQGTAYTVTTTLFNEYGNTTSSGTSITTGSPPGTPNAPTLVSATQTSLTLRSNLSGGPFYTIDFLITDSSGNPNYAVIANDTDGNGLYIADASGNYTGTITDLTPNTSYSVTVTYTNEYAQGNSSPPLTASTSSAPPPPGTPPAPTLVSKTLNSLTVRASTTGITGTPFTSYRFRATDSSNNTFDSSGNGAPDASGNYNDTISGLSQGTAYTVTTTLFNEYGNTTSSGTSITTGSVPGTPNAPTQVSLTTTSVTVRTSTTGITGTPFSSYRFRATDSSNNTFDSSGNGSPDASGNYNDTISGLSPGRQYTVTATLFNAYGNTTSSGTSITTGAVPGTANAPTQVSVTTTSVTVRTSTTGISGTPFTSYRFRATDSSNNTFDSSGNGAPDASGNYNDTISGLNSSTLYNVTATLFNLYGAGPTSTSTPMTTSSAAGPSPGTANAPTLVSKTTTTITMTSNPVGISGSPFTSGLFTVKTTGGTTVTTANPTTTDASGNYTSTLTGLTQNTSYNVTFALSNSNGSGPTSSATSVTTGALPGTPNAPTQISVTTTSITVRTSTSGLAGSPFTSYRFRATDSSNNTFDSSGNGAPDSSGNYNDTISGLTQGRVYSVTATLFNIYGNTTSPASQIATTTPPPGTPSAPTLIANGSTYVNLRENVSGLSGSPFTECVFNFADSSNNSVTSFSLQGPPDSSGNYNITTDNTLSPLTYYKVTATVTNAGGSATSASNLQFTTLNESTMSTLVSKTTNSIIVVNNLQTDSSGSTITGPYSNVSINYAVASGIFQFSISAFSVASGTVSGPDGSGNYTGTITGLSSNTTYNVFFSFTTSNGNIYTTTPLSVTTNSNGICFKTGSKILCLKDNKEQYVPVEELRRGDLLRTLSGEYIKINLIGKSTIDNPDNGDRGPNRLFILRRANYPELNEDLIITGCHSRLVDRLTEQQKKRHLQLMANLYITTGKFRLMAFIDEKAEPYRDPGVHEIWHFALDNVNEVCNYGVYANGLLVETASIKNMRKIAGINLL